MVILIFFVAHWYLSLFCQTFYMHRYAAHADFRMSRFWDRFFHLASFFTMGSSYLSPRAYAIMHRMHHAYADTPKDPHSPLHFSNIMAMMMKTENVFTGILNRKIETEPRFSKNVPDWPALDRFANALPTRLFWAALYTTFFIAYATHWWLFLLLPVTALMSPVHGAVINWFAHKFGYTNFKLNNTSKNLWPVDLIMLGEGFHNNHHMHASSINFGVKWFELDPVYPVILLFSRLGIVRLHKQSAVAHIPPVALPVIPLAAELGIVPVLAPVTALPAKAELQSK